MHTMHTYTHCSPWAVAEMVHLSAFCQEVTLQFTCTYALVVSTCAIHHLLAAKQLFGDSELAHMYLVIVLLAAPCAPGCRTTGDTPHIRTTGKWVSASSKVVNYSSFATDSNDATSAVKQSLMFYQEFTAGKCCKGLLIHTLMVNSYFTHLYTLRKSAFFVQW